MSCVVAPAIFAPITLRSGAVLASENDRFNDDDMWALNMKAYCFNDLASYPAPFRKHIESFTAVTDPEQGALWSARTAYLYMLGLVRTADQWVDHIVTYRCSGYSALALATTIHESAGYCARYPNTRRYSESGAQRLAHQEAWRNIDVLYSEIVRIWNSRLSAAP